MKRKNIAALLALVLVFSLALTGCGEQAPAETTAAATEPAAPAVPQPLGLASFELSASTWSSPNGATIHLTAVPTGYMEGQSAAFIVRMEGEEVANIPCDWDGSQYTASADLNAENGLCYYVVLTPAEGESVEVAVNTPGEPVNEEFINMADALNSYCSVTVVESTAAEGKLSITQGTVQVQAPRITNQGETISVKDATLVLCLNGEPVKKEAVTLEETDDIGAYQAALTSVVFELPQMAADDQLTLRLDVSLSNNQLLTAHGGIWYNSDNGLMAAVG